MSLVPPERSNRKRVVLSAEQLEDRTQPSGNITASVSNGTLQVTGDSAANQVWVMALDGGEALVTPLGDTTVNGGRSPLVLGGITLAYSIQLAGGDDFLWVTNTQGDRALIVETGDGNDGLTVDYASHTGPTILSTGSGNDTVALGMGTLQNATAIYAGAGDDRLFVGGTEFGSLILDGGSGLNSAGFLGVKFHSTPATTGFQRVYSTLMPLAAPDTATVGHGATSTINVAANDSAPGISLDLSSVQITAQPQHGTVRTNSNGTVTYTADSSAATSDSFKYTIQNLSGAVSNEVVVTLVLTGGQTPQPTGPTPTITTTAATATNLGTIPFTVTFDRDVTGFDATDLTATNATVSDFVATNARTYTFTLAPTADGTVTVSIAAGAAKDSANQSSLAATKSITSDRTSPTVTVAARASSDLTSIPITVTFSEPITGFSLAGITVTGGTAAGFTPVNSRTFNLTVTPVAGGGLVTVAVPGGVATDTAGNQNLASTQFTSLTSRTDAGMVSTTAPPDPNDPSWQTMANGLKVWDVQVGSGPAVATTSTISVFYTGWLLDGTVFDAARTSGSPATFSLTSLIAGWQQGLPGMTLGGIRRLYIPAELAYGAAGSGSIPPNSDLIFEIKLVALS